MGLTYADDGKVDSKEEVNGIRALANMITNHMYNRPLGNPISNIGHYAGLIDFGEYAIALTTDGVGSKILIANEMKKWNTVGIDCIAMNVNDLLTMNITPIAFTDYIAIEKPNEEKMAQIGEGLQKGAEISKMNITGGETATLPDIVNGFDLAGTCLGIAKKDEIITGEEIEIGDAILGIPSSGVHSNGYSLVRAIIKKAGLSYSDPLPYNPSKTIGEELLTPTRIYLEVLDAAKECVVNGMAHITGKGTYEKLRRITPYGMEISDPLEIHPVFDFLQKEGDVDDLEMRHTFNMGMGFVVVLPQYEVERALKMLPDAKKVGEIIKEPECNINIDGKMTNVWTWNK